MTYTRQPLTTNKKSHLLPSNGTIPGTTASVYSNADGNGDTVCVRVPQPAVCEAPSPGWSWWSTVWSALVMTILASLCGLVALLCSIHAYVDHKTGDYEASRRKRQWAWLCGALGMLVAVLGAVAIILILMVFSDDLQDFLTSIGYTQ